MNYFNNNPYNLAFLYGQQQNKTVNPNAMSYNIFQQPQNSTPASQTQFAPKPEVTSTPTTPPISTGSTGADYLKGGAAAVQGLAGLAGAYIGYQQLKLAKEQFKFAKAEANRNIHNQAKIINNQIDSAANITSQLNRKEGMTLADYKADRDRIQQEANKSKVDGSKIG